MEFLYKSALSSSVSERNLLVLIDASVPHHTFLFGPARLTDLRISALIHSLSSAILALYILLYFHKKGTGNELGTCLHGLSGREFHG